MKKIIFSFLMLTLISTSLIAQESNLTSKNKTNTLSFFKEGPIVGVGYTGAIGIRKRRHPNECFFMLWICKPKKVTVHSFVYDDISVDFGDDWGSDEARANPDNNEADFSFVFIEEKVLRMTIMSKLTAEYNNSASITIDDETIFDDQVVELLGYKSIVFKNQDYEIKTDGKGRKYVDLIVESKE